MVNWRENFGEIWLDISAEIFLFFYEFGFWLYFLYLLLFFEGLVETVLRVFGHIAILFVRFLGTIGDLFFLFKKSITVFIWVFEFLPFVLLWLFNIRSVMLSLFTNKFIGSRFQLFLLYGRSKGVGRH